MTLANADVNARLARIAAGQREAGGKMVLHVGEAEVRVKSLQGLMPCSEQVHRKLSGVVLASMSLHNLAFFAPDKAKRAFGLPWVQRPLATTEPASLVFRTEVHTL